MAWPPHYDGATLSSICISFNLLLLLRNRKILRPFPFTSCRIGGGGLSLGVSLPLFNCPSGLSLFHSVQALAPTLNSLVLFFFLTCTFCISLFSACSFPLHTCIRITTNNHKTEPILGCLDISSTRKINSLFFNFVSGILRQRQKAVTLVEKHH